MVTPRGDSPSKWEKWLLSNCMSCDCCKISFSIFFSSSISERRFSHFMRSQSLCFFFGFNVTPLGAVQFCFNCAERNFYGNVSRPGVNFSSIFTTFRVCLKLSLACLTTYFHSEIDAAVQTFDLGEISKSDSTWIFVPGSLSCLLQQTWLPILIMITYLLGASYLIGTAGIAHCIVSVWRLDDELHAYTQMREQDFTYDRTDLQVGVPRKSLVLMRLAEGPVVEK